MWDDASRDEQQVSYVHELRRALQPYSSGGYYPNYESDVAAGQIKSAFGPKKYERLLSVKKKYVPDNFFRLNPNISPTG